MRISSAGPMRIAVEETLDSAQEAEAAGDGAAPASLAAGLAAELASGAAAEASGAAAEAAGAASDAAAAGAEASGAGVSSDFWQAATAKNIGTRARTRYLRIIFSFVGPRESTA